MYSAIPRKIKKKKNTTIQKDTLYHANKISIMLLWDFQIFVLFLYALHGFFFRSLMLVLFFRSKFIRSVCLFAMQASTNLREIEERIHCLKMNVWAMIM